MTYAERAFRGPDAWGRTFRAEPVAHCAARDEHRRIHQLLDRTRARMARATQRAARQAFREHSDEVEII